MCDCYTAKCNYGDLTSDSPVGSCTARVEMHLADFDTRRNEVQVYCEEHTPEKEDRKDGILWAYRDGEKQKWRHTFVRALTENARKNAEGNHPNAGITKIIEEFGESPLFSLSTLTGPFSLTASRRLAKLILGRLKR